MLLAFSARPEELEVVMLSVQFGNVDVQKYSLNPYRLCPTIANPRSCRKLNDGRNTNLPRCLRNIVSLFHFIEKERAWRKANGRPEGFDALKAKKPIGMLFLSEID
jgi:hypothetical protein